MFSLNDYLAGAGRPDERPVSVSYLINRLQPLPFETPGWYVTPKFGVNSTHYSLSGQKAETPDTITRNLPIFSVDSGMTFERTDKWFGRDYTQTLEPRLYYLNVP